MDLHFLAVFFNLLMDLVYERFASEGIEKDI